MKLGIMSDNHGRLEPIRHALRLLEEGGAEAYVHCGDVGGLDVLEELAGRRCWFVWGNTDLPRPGWRRHVEELGLSWPDGPVSIDLVARSIGIFHGHEPGLDRAIHDGRYDYLLHGHSHRQEDYRVGRTRVINPGALHRAPVKTVALLDLEHDGLEFIEVS